MTSFLRLAIYFLLLSLVFSQVIYDEKFFNVSEKSIHNFLPNDLILNDHEIIYISLTQLESDSDAALSVCTSNSTLECLYDKNSISFDKEVQYVRIMNNIANDIMQKEYSALPYAKADYFIRVQTTQTHNSSFQIKVEITNDTICYQPCKNMNQCNNGMCECDTGEFGIDCSINAQDVLQIEEISKDGLYYISLNNDQDFTKYLTREMRIKYQCGSSPYIYDYNDIRYAEWTDKIQITKEDKQFCLDSFQQQKIISHIKPSIIIQLFYQYPYGGDVNGTIDPATLGIVLGCVASLFLFLILGCVDFCKKTCKKYEEQRKLKELKKKLNHFMPSFLYSIVQMKFPGLKEENQCLICLTTFKMEDFVRLTCCTHLFHEECIEQWVIKNKTKATCPICRECFNDKMEKNNMHLEVILTDTQRLMQASSNNPEEATYLKKLSHRLLGTNEYNTQVQTQTDLNVEPPQKREEGDEKQ